MYVYIYIYIYIYILEFSRRYPSTKFCWQRRRDAFAEVLDPFSRNNVRWKRRRDAFAEVLDHLVALAEALALERRFGCP